MARCHHAWLVTTRTRHVGLEARIVRQPEGLDESAATLDFLAMQPIFPVVHLPRREPTQGARAGIPFRVGALDEGLRPVVPRQPQLTVQLPDPVARVAA